MRKRWTRKSLQEALATAGSPWEIETDGSRFVLRQPLIRNSSEYRYLEFRGQPQRLTLSEIAESFLR